MLYSNIEQGVHCETLRARMNGLQQAVADRLRHLDSLKDRLTSVRHNLQDKHRQVARTGDEDGFRNDIVRLEDEISNLNRQISAAEADRRDLDRQIASVLSDMEASGCTGLH